MKFIFLEQVCKRGSGAAIQLLGHAIKKLFFILSMLEFLVQ